ADMAMRRMDARGDPADERHHLRFLRQVVRPEIEALAEERQDRGVLGDELAIVEAERRHAAMRIDLQILGRALLALGKIDPAAVVFLAAFLEYDMRGHRARAGAVAKSQHSFLP